MGVSPPPSAGEHEDEVTEMYMKAAEFTARRIEVAVEAYEDRIWVYGLLNLCKKRARAVEDRQRLAGAAQEAMELRIAERAARAMARSEGEWSL